MKKKQILVVGLGYVGLAMATLCANATKKSRNIYEVYGLEKNSLNGKKILKNLNKNILPFKVEDVYFKRSLTNSLRKKSLLVGLDQNKITTSSIVIISVNFDVELKKAKINFKNLKKIVQDVALRIRPGCLIIVESTLPPGTTSKIIYPEIVEIFKKRKIELDKIRLAYSFERVTPGSNYLNSIKLMHRVYAGINKQSELEVKRFLKSIIDTRQAKLCKLSSITEAETCKIIENTYRAMNIAFIEEWRNFSSLNGLNLNEILNFIRFRKTHNNIMRPGIGVGGYCLTKDPLMGEIASKKILKKKAKLPISQNVVQINQRMPKEVLSDIENRLKFRNLEKKNVFLFGASYRQGVGDTRFSASEFVYNYFLKKKCKIRVIDPYLNYWKEVKCKVYNNFDYKKVDIAFFLVPHKQFKNLKLNFKKNCIVIDSNNVFSEKKSLLIKKKYKKNYIIGNYN